jgi:hypothetical protein
MLNEKAETAPGILFKNQSAMEAHHCSVAICIGSKNEPSIFAALAREDYQHVWTMLISLFLPTDITKHFSFLDEFGAILDAGPVDVKNPKLRSYATEMIRQCVDISDGAKPFKMPDKSCEMLCEEFSRQRESEPTRRMSDRAHLDESTSQARFNTFVRLPLYQMAAMAMRELQVHM